MYGAKYNAHTEPLLKGCNILKIEDIFKLSCLKLYHKYINRMLASFFSTTFSQWTLIYIHMKLEIGIICIIFRTTGKVPANELDFQCPIWLIYYPLIFYCICICVNMLPSLCINMVHICEDAIMYDMHSTSHHNCAVGNVSCYHHILHYSYINVWIKIEPTHLSPHKL